MNSYGKDEKRGKQSSSRPAESTASTRSNLSQSEILSRVLRSTSESMSGAGSEIGPSVFDTSSPSLPSHLDPADRFVRSSRSHRPQAPSPDAHRPSTRPCRDDIEILQVERTNQTTQSSSEAVGTSRASTIETGSGSPVPPLIRVTNSRVGARPKLTNIQENTTPEEHFPSDQDETGTPTTNLLEASKEWSREVWQAFCSGWSFFFHWFPYWLLHKPIGYLFFLGSLCFPICIAYIWVTGYLCESTVLQWAANLHVVPPRTFCMEYETLRNLTDHPFAKSTLAESNISSVHVWLIRVFEKMESDLKTHSDTVASLAESEKMLDASRSNIIRALESSLKIERSFETFHSQLSVELCHFINNFPKIKPGRSWRWWISYISSASYSDATHTTEDLNRAIDDISKTMVAMSKEYKNPTKTGKQYRNKLCESIKKGTEDGKKEVEGLYATCIVWNKGISAIESVVHGRTLMLIKDTLWLEATKEQLKAQMSTIKKKRWTKNKRSDDELEEMVVFNYELAYEVLLKLREYSTQHYW